MKNRSKFLSLILRHKPETIGIKLDNNGWVMVSTLLKQMKNHGKEISLGELIEVVETNDKKRFELSNDGLMIRASQGHSVKVDLDIKPQTPPTKLYHGTVEKFMDAISKNGLKKMNRHAVHLSEELETATKVASRRGKPIILKIDAEAMKNDGFEFFKSNNGVWLTNHVPTKYITK